MPLNYKKSWAVKIRNFDESLWNDNAQDIVFQGNLAKFQQNQDLSDWFNTTKDKHIVEGAHYDRIWGVGLSWDDEKIIDPDNWNGSNWLGEALMRVRDVLRSDIA